MQMGIIVQPGRSEKVIHLDLDLPSGSFFIYFFFFFNQFILPPGKQKENRMAIDLRLTVNRHIIKVRTALSWDCIYMSQKI